MYYCFFNIFITILQLLHVHNTDVYCVFLRFILTLLLKPVFLYLILYCLFKQFILLLYHNWLGMQMQIWFIMGEKPQNIKTIKQNDQRQRTNKMKTAVQEAAYKLHKAH